MDVRRCVAPTGEEVDARQREVNQFMRNGLLEAWLATLRQQFFGAVANSLGKKFIFPATANLQPRQRIAVVLALVNVGGKRR